MTTEPEPKRKRKQTLNTINMKGELITKWGPVLTQSLYHTGELGRTITYHKLIERTDFKIAREELMIILGEVNEAEYRKYKIFIVSLAVRNDPHHGIRLPDEKWFSAIIEKKSSTRPAMTFTDICLYEKERAIQVIREVKRKERMSTHNLW